MKKLFSFVLVLVLVLACATTAFAAVGDDTAGTIGGVSVTMGTGNAALASASGGSVTLTTAQATNAAANFTDTDSTTVKVLKYTSATIGEADPAADPAYNSATDSISDGDIFVVWCTDMATDVYYQIAVTIDDGSVPPPPQGSTGSETVTGDGETEYIDLEIYKVTLPTNATMDYILDPQGLTAIDDGTTVDLASLVGGKIISIAAPKAINNSAVDVKLSVALTATGDATFIAYDEDDATTTAAVKADTDNNILLYAAPSSVDIVNTETEYAASANGYVITKSASTLDFVLGAADYEVTNTDGVYTVAPKANTGHGTAIQLGGLVNSTANWAAYAGDSPSKTAGVEAVFSFQKATETESGTATVAGIPGLITDADALALTPPTVGFIGGTSATALTVTKAALTEATELSIPFNFVDKTLVSIKVPSGTAIAAADYTVTGNAITFTAARTTAFKALATDFVLTITLNDDTTYALTLDMV